MNITIRGKKWKVRWVTRLGPDHEPHDGRCDWGRKTIVMRKGQPAETELETFIHELLHASLPVLHEDEVNDTARDIAAALKKAEYCA